MSFTYSYDASKGGSYSTKGDLIDTALNYGGYDIYETGTIDSLKNDYIIFGGGGSGIGVAGRNAVQIESSATIDTFLNLGSLCGGGGAGGTGVDVTVGGAGGGGGGCGYFGNESGGGNGGNGLQGLGGDAYRGGGGGGGFGANGGFDALYPNSYGLGSLAGGGCGNAGNSGVYGASMGSSAGGGGAGGGRAGQGEPSDGAPSGGGAGGGSGGGIPSFNSDNNGGSGGYGIYNYGTINTLENQQGIGFGLGALFYAGNLPTNYNIIIQSESSFGQLFYTGIANVNSYQPYVTPIPIPGSIINFDISDLTSTTSLVDSYDAVLVNIDITGPLAGVKNGVNWELSYVRAGDLNCKGNIVTIGRVNYDSYDLIITSTPSYYINLNSLIPSRGQTGQTLTVVFTTNVIVVVGDSVDIYFDKTKVTGTITKIETDKTVNAICTIPSGSGSVPITLSIDIITSDSLEFIYTSSPTSSTEIYFIGDNQITDSYNNLFAFDINTPEPTTSISFSVTVNNIKYQKCTFKFDISEDKDYTSSVTLTVTNNLKDYNLIYKPYIYGNNNVKTYITYLDEDGFLIKIPFSFTYINGTNSWYFVNSTTSTDESNLITYYPEINYISAISTNTVAITINLQNIGTLGMCGASNAFVNGPSSNTKDTINASVAWCFYSLYNLTQSFTL